MPKVNPLWSSFAAGEISPRMFSRSDTEAWKAGLFELKNCVATSHGPVIRRQGTHYVTNSVGATDGRVFGFEYRRGIGFHICVTDIEIIFIDVSDPKAPIVEQRIVTGLWNGDQLPLIYADSPPEGDKLLLTAPEVPPQELIYDASEVVGSRWTLGAIDFDDAPNDWDTDNWPSAIAFFEGRMWLAATTTSPQTVWASRSGDFYDFTGAGSTEADDALEFVISKRGKIEWLGAAKNMIVGAVNQEYLITSDAGVIKANDVQIEPQSSYGSKDIQALLLGNVMLYVSPDGLKMRDIGYRWEENNWLSRDITFLSEHITRKNAIRQIAWSQQPDNLIWAVTEPGDLLGCTYERYHDVIGWHNHDTQGDYKGVGVVDVNGISVTMFCVSRVDGEMYFEIDAADDIYMDSHLEVVPVGDDHEITVPHLPNYLVQVTVAGAVHPDVQLDADGKGNLQYIPDPARPNSVDIALLDGSTVTRILPPNVVIAGLSYLSRVVTLPLDYTPEEPGTSSHWMKRWSKVYVRVLNSVKPRIGKDRPPERLPRTPMDLPEPAALLEDVKVIGLGWDRFSQVFIEQDLPLPMTITGVFGELSQEADD